MDLPGPELIAFIDESGDFELRNINPHYPVCAQCALTSTVEGYLAKSVPALLRVKYDFFGNECIVLHGSKIRRRSGPFSILSDISVREDFQKAIARALEEIDGCLIVAAVHKQRHVATYLRPYDPFYLSLKFLLERLYLNWSLELRKGKRLLCVFESRGKNEDQRTTNWFNGICAGDNQSNAVFPFDLDFRPKDQNVIGHQYADLVAYAACRFVETWDDTRSDWLAVKGKLRAVYGERIGHGLKVFP